jgi:UDP-N-acetylmuramyl pentapeptide phosphotransferase/UDP-N-acetylglucosamine-1-phosphate transferase
VFSPFIVDASVTLLRRVAAGERPWHAHRSHFYQRLVHLGWGHRKTVVREYCLMFACACAAAAALRLTTGGQMALLGAWVGVYVMLMFGITSLERRAQT